MKKKIVLEDLLIEESDMCQEGIEFFKENYPDGLTAETFIKSKALMGDRHTAYFFKMVIKQDTADFYWSKNIIQQNKRLFTIKFLVNLMKLPTFNNEYIFSAFQSKNPQLLDYNLLYKTTNALNEERLKTYIKLTESKKTLIHSIAKILTNKNNIELVSRDLDLKDKIENEINENTSIYQTTKIEDFLTIYSIYDNELINKTNNSFMCLNKVQDVVELLNLSDLVVWIRKFGIIRNRKTYKSLMDKIPSRDDLNKVESALLDVDVEAYEDFMRFFNAQKERG